MENEDAGHDDVEYKSPEEVYRKPFSRRLPISRPKKYYENKPLRPNESIVLSLKTTTINMQNEDLENGGEENGFLLLNTGIPEELIPDRDAKQKLEEYLRSSFVDNYIPLKPTHEICNMVNLVNRATLNSEELLEAIGPVAFLGVASNLGWQVKLDELSHKKKNQAVQILLAALGLHYEGEPGDPGWHAFVTKHQTLYRPMEYFRPVLLDSLIYRITEGVILNGINVFLNKLGSQEKGDKFIIYGVFDNVISFFSEVDYKIKSKFELKIGDESFGGLLKNVRYYSGYNVFNYNITIY